MEINRLDASAQLRWIRPAQQVRSVETRQRLMDSAEALMTEKGFADVPVA
jgi:AcrR family transcriptional regulator